MIMELIRRDKLKVKLQKEELEKYFLTYDLLDYKEPETKKIIYELLIKAKAETGFHCGNGRLLIEAFPMSDGGCLLIFNIVSGNECATRRGNSIPPLSPYIFEFNNSDEVFLAARMLKKKHMTRIYKSHLHRLDGKFFLTLLPFVRFNSGFVTMMSEFTSSFRQGSAAMSFLEEHGEKLADGDAVQKLSGEAKPAE